MAIVFDFVTFSFQKECQHQWGHIVRRQKLKNADFLPLPPSSLILKKLKQSQQIMNDFFSQFNVSPLLCSIWVLHFIFKIEMSLHETMLRMSIVIKYALLHEFLWLLNTLCCLCLYIFPFFLQSLVDNTYSAKSEEVSYNK